MVEEEKSLVSEALNSAIQKLKDLPAAQEASTQPSQMVEKVSRADRLFGREKSVHELLGSGKGADILLWRNARVSAGILVFVTIVYVVFEWLGWHVLPVLSIGSLIVLGTLFLWSNIASLVKRSPPNVPLPQIPQDKALHVAQVLRDQVNLVMAMLRDVVLGKDIKLFLKVELALWIISLVGKWADFLTLVYLGVFLLLTLPVLYERHEDKVDYTIKRGYEQTRRLGGKLHEQILVRVPHLALQKQKKSV